MEKLQGYIDAIKIYFDDHGFMAKLAAAFFIIVIGWILISLISKIIDKILTKRKFDATLQPFLINLFVWMSRAMLFVIAVAIVGIETTSMVAMLGAVGFAMGMERIDFMWYLKKIAWLALIGYVAGAAVFMVMRTLLM